MLKQHKKQFSGIFRLVDVLFVIVSLYAAYYVRFRSFDLNILDLPLQYQIFFPVNFAAWLYLSQRFGLYTSKRTTPFKREALDVGKVITGCMILALVPAFFLRDYPLSRIFLVTLWVLQVVTLSLFRLVLREWLKYIRKRGYNFRQLLIVGRNDRAGQLVKKIESSPEFGLRILGFIDAPNGHSSSYPPNLNDLGGLRDLERVLRENVVDEVFVFLPMKSFYGEIEEIIQICETVGVEVKIPTDLFNLSLAKSTVSLYHEIPMIDLYTSPKMNWQLLVKRLIDVVSAAIGLIILSPLFAVVGILIKATSKGPIFFKQERVGYNGRLFDCLKFRTMVENAEELKEDLASKNEMDGPVFKIKDDPRVTKVGRILRKTSFDETPQLINVLKGEMSLVGPRPPVPSEVTQYDLKDLRRLSMRPGITCLWQVNGRNSIPFEKWMELDKEYIDHWSLWLDLKILAKTIPAVLRGSGAV